MSVSAPHPGWYPDPADPASSYRWWDGAQWTTEIRSAFAPSPAPSGAAGLSASPGWTEDAGAWTQSGGGTGRTGFGPGRADTAGPTGSFGQANQGSLTAIGVSALYVLIALTSHFVLLGFVPAAAAVRAFKRREPLAPIAAVAAAVSIVVAFVSLSGR